MATASQDNSGYTPQSVLTSPDELGFDELVGSLRAIAEPTRVRLIALLGREELTVTEISRVIGQSQPRVSRHLRLLVDAGVLERAPEGNFVYYRLAEDSPAAELAHELASLTPASDPVMAADLAALSRVRAARIEAAIAYRSTHADELEALRALYVGEAAVERALLDMLIDEGPIGRLLDIGTGTGRILELLAPHSEQSVGLDLDHDMLQLARAALGEAQLSRAAVRHGDLHRPPFEAGSFDVAVMHHVLHLLDSPGGAIEDAARLLRPGGRLLVADFASHDLEALRSVHGHRCLGISDKEMLSWAVQAGLEVESERTLPPAAPDEQLTVRLWLLRAQSNGSQPRPARAGRERAGRERAGEERAGEERAGEERAGEERAGEGQAERHAAQPGRQRQAGASDAAEPEPDAVATGAGR